MRHQVSRVLPYRADDLFRLVGDVEAYPQFVPWIQSMRTWNHRDLGAGADRVDAAARVGFAFLKESFTTRVTRSAPGRKIEVALISGPFRKLANTWTFTPLDEGSTRVDFDIDFEFKSRLLDGLLAANFERAVGRLMGCFEDRARALYGAR